MSGEGLTDAYDAVVMLTWSDWRTEPRSNRYHYATRFSKHLPVLFVQPDLERDAIAWEATELANVTVVHVSARYGWRQTRSLQRALRQEGVRRPLLWIYNYLFLDFIYQRPWAPAVFHGTESYVRDFFGSRHRWLLAGTLKRTDLLIAVSEGVRSDYERQGGYSGQSAVVTNGCDFHYWQDGKVRALERPDPAVVLFQGGINQRLDLTLVARVVDIMEDWQFRFCGRVSFADAALDKQWLALLAKENFTYLGELALDELRKEMYGATVGMIPFVRTEFILHCFFPLKAFEYLACGLPVVTVPCKSLTDFPEVFEFADNPEGFAARIRTVAATRWDPRSIARRREAARAQDYDLKFEQVCRQVCQPRLVAAGQGRKVPWAQSGALRARRAALATRVGRLGLRAFKRLVNRSQDL